MCLYIVLLHEPALLVPKVCLYTLVTGFYEFSKLAALKFEIEKIFKISKKKVLLKSS